jgi:alpha-D-ribose 1-methylphosphonate 5-triphosphate synthase subunit PhnL
MYLANIMHFCTKICQLVVQFNLLHLQVPTTALNYFASQSVVSILRETSIATGCKLTDYSSLQISVLVLHRHFHLFQYHRLHAGKYF